MAMPSRKYFLEDELFPRKTTGDAQIPFLYEEEHSKLFNEIVNKGTRHKDEYGRVYYTLSDCTYIIHNRR